MTSPLRRAPGEADPPPVQGYKVVEVSPVADETLERALNEWTAEGFSFESIHFVMREGSHRPALAYLFFVRGEPPGRAPSVGRG
ncbi:DUF4177 domain-containing protein [Anaeromyxobacter oryzisoli]|uniref:DUF4177 domain-containing protein n=1 Tax=Anaeromyxobacter oryzisoli TaxID=2925408 RepID=UPI001F56BE9D|nr:DUF4177 domain-containing protein [Anaeromyxobacter sp. SG63]